MSNTNPARGMRDFLPEQIRKRNYVIGIIREVYEKYGFEPLETPTIENLSTLTNKYGEEGDQLMFKILKRGEKLKKKLEAGEIRHENELTDLALRYDLTVPLSRVIANNRHQLPKFFKRYQIQPVWRADRPAKGRYREFYQCDVDAIGSKSMLVEAELCSAVSEILDKLRFDDFVILLNHRKILFGFLEVAGVKKEKQIETLMVLDKFDKIGEQAVLNELDKKAVFKEKNGIEFLRKYIEIMKVHLLGAKDVPDEVTEEYQIKNQIEDNKTILKKLEDFLGDNETGKAGIKSCREILDYSFNTTAKGKIRLQPILSRGLSYYTGAIFEIGLNRLDFKGSICGGGRYDGLIGMFGKEQIPAVGLSLGLERILYVMEERGVFQELIDEGKIENNVADVLVTVWNEETASESLKLAGELRQENLRVVIYPQADKLGKQFKYADQIGVRYSCILREEEIEEHKVKLKDLKTSDEEPVDWEEIGEKLSELLKK